MLAETQLVDYSGILNQILLIITALGSLVAAIGVLISKLRGDRIEKGQEQAKNAAVAAVATAQAVSTKLDDNTRKTEETQKKIEHVTVLVNSQASRNEEERKELTQKVETLKNEAATAIVKETIREVMASQPAGAPRRITDFIPAPIPVVIENPTNKPVPVKDANDASKGS